MARDWFGVRVGEPASTEARLRPLEGRKRSSKAALRTLSLRTTSESSIGGRAPRLLPLDQAEL